jgi:hypothetical protein
MTLFVDVMSAGQNTVILQKSKRTQGQRFRERSLIHAGIAGITFVEL